MKINSQLYQFPHQRALLVTAGKQEAVCYLAGDGEIKVLEKISVPPPRFTDNEGFYKDKKDGIVRAGAVKEINRKKLLSDLHSSLNKLLRQWSEYFQITNIYLFAPSYLIRELKESLPDALQKKVRGSFGGEYIKAHPFDLIEKIEAAMSEKRVAPIRKEAAGLLKRRPPPRAPR